MLRCGNLWLHRVMHTDDWLVLLATAIAGRAITPGALRFAGVPFFFDPVGMDKERPPGSGTCRAAPLSDDAGSGPGASEEAELIAQICG